MTGLNRDDIIRKFLDLHPDIPIDGQKYAIPLRIISRMLEVAAAAERESCAKVCEDWTRTPETTGMELSLCAKAIRARGQQ